MPICPKRAAPTQLSPQISPNLPHFAVERATAAAPQIQVKILHGKIVALARPPAAPDFMSSLHPMSCTLTRLAVQSVVRGVLQCETTSSQKEIRDLVR